MFSIRTILLASAVIMAAPASAQDASAEPRQQERGEPGSDDLHGQIVVRAAGLDRLDVLAGTSVLHGIELQRDLDGQLGDVLAKLPGVSASSFSPGASRPILRGFGGERVRVLTDGIGVLDASSTSDDHAVTAEPLITDRIEVLRGPAVLLYGSQAIGGAVNVVTRRIPPRVPDEPVHLDALAAFDTAADRREGGLSIDVPLSANVAFHVDGSYRTTDDLEIPGFVASDSLRAELLSGAAEEEEEGHVDEAAELREGAEARGVLPNSWTETWTLGSGIAFHQGANNLGFSFDYYDTQYGIPGLPGGGHVHEHEEEGEEHEHEEEHGKGEVSIGMKRYRADMRGALDLGTGFFEAVEGRLGYSDYTHTEFEGDEIGTVFDVEGLEGRLELVQAPRGGWRGSLGVQYSHLDFAAVGEEAFVPSNATQSMALFTLQEIDFDPLQLELGGRYERTEVEARELPGAGREFDSVSAALGVSYALGSALDEFSAGVNVSRAERAPSAQELFAEGPHIATQQYEIGNAALGIEGSWGIEGYVRGALGRVQVSASVYRNWFDDFIYLKATGAEADGLEVFQFLQQDADQFGIEGEIELPLLETGGLTVLADLRGDYVRATLADGRPVPRMPPLSLLGALEAQTGHFDARAEVQWIDEQERVAEFETPTEGFTFVNLSLAWHPLEGADNLTIIAQANNVFDQEGRRHASFTKEFVPLSGRNLRLTARASF
jgi:iron complex outermembrane receptor protein